MTRTVRLTLALASALLIHTSALAQSTINGTWEVEMTTPQGVVNTFDVTLTQSGDAVAGELVSPLGTVPLKGTMVENAIAVTASIDVQGMSINLVFDGTFADDSMKGTVKLGDFGDAPWVARRKGIGTSATSAAAPAPAATANNAAGIAGTWNITMNIAGNAIAATAALQQEGTKVSGTMSGQQGDIAVGGSMTGSTLKLEFPATTAQGSMNITMTGDLAGDALTGKMTIEGLGEVDWTGTRAR